MERADLIMIPPNCRNGGGLFLDDLDLDGLSEHWMHPYWLHSPVLQNLFTYLKEFMKERASYIVRQPSVSNPFSIIISQEAAISDPSAS